MTIREVIRFQTDDGSEFDSRVMAEHHLAMMALVSHLQQGVNLHTLTLSQLAEWLMENYDLTPKDPP